MRRGLLRRSNRGPIIPPATSGMVAKQRIFNPSYTMPGIVPSKNQSTIPGASQSQIAAFNDNTQQIQGFRYSLNQGSNPFTPTLSSSGKFFKGLAISLSTFASLGDTQITFQINNRTMLQDVNCLLLIPNYSQGLLYYPLPQPLTGKDTFKVDFTKNDAGTVVTFLQFVYVPYL